MDIISTTYTIFEDTFIYMRKTLLFFLFSIHSLFAQEKYELIARSPYEGFRFYNTSNGFASIYDENNNKLVSYHSSALSGLIVRSEVEINNLNNIQTEEIDWIDNNSPMRGGGFDIEKNINDDSFYLYGIGTRKDECYEFVGATIFRKKIQFTKKPIWNDFEFSMERRRFDIEGFDSRANNGISDKYGNYFFCNYGANKNLYVINFNDNEEPKKIIDLTDYIIEFKKVDDGNLTHIIGIEDNKKHFIYIVSDGKGKYHSKRYSIKKLTNKKDVELYTKYSFDIGKNNNSIEFMFFTKKNKLFSVELDSKRIRKVKIKYEYGFLKDEIKQSQIDNVRGLLYLRNGKCLLIPYDGKNLFFNGTKLSISQSKTQINGQIVDKIYKLSNNDKKSIMCVTRQHESIIDSDFKNIRLFKIGGIDKNKFDTNVYRIGLNKTLVNKVFEHGGGPKIRSIAVSNNHLLYDGWDRIVYKNMLSEKMINDTKYLNLNTTALIPINSNEFLAGLYFGPFIQRFRIDNNKIIIMDKHFIKDHFSKISSLAFDGKNVYIGLYHNSQSSINYCNIYKYNTLIENNNNQAIDKPLFKIEQTNFITTLKVDSISSNKSKFLYGIAQNARKGVFKIFRKELIDNGRLEEIQLENLINTDINDMEIIMIDNLTYLFYITERKNGGDLYKIRIDTKNYLSSSQIQHVRSFDIKPMKLSSVNNKNLIITFTCKQIGIITNEDNPKFLQLKDLPLPIDYTQNTITTTDGYLFVGTREGVGNIYKNNEGGGVFKFELPVYDRLIKGDFNGDGRKDLITVSNNVNRTSKIFLFKKNENLNYINFGFSNVDINNFDFFFIGDIDGDGYDDLGIKNSINESNESSRNWKFYLNDKNGNFINSNHIIYKWKISPDKVSMIDVNDDGFDDLVVYKNDNWYIRMNNKANSFSKTYIKYTWDNFLDYVFSENYTGMANNGIGAKLLDSFFD